MPVMRTDEGAEQSYQAQNAVIEASPRGRFRNASIQAVMLDQLLAKVEEQIQEQGIKASVSDYVRLVQLRREIHDEQPREVLVKWVESSREEDALKK